LPARIGSPMNIGGLVDVVNSPMHATGVGLVMFGAEELRAGRSGRISEGNVFSNVMGRMKEWIEGFI